MFIRLGNFNCIEPWVSISPQWNIKHVPFQFLQLQGLYHHVMGLPKQNIPVIWAKQVDNGYPQIEVGSLNKAVKTVLSFGERVHSDEQLRVTYDVIDIEMSTWIFITWAMSQSSLKL